MSEETEFESVGSENWKFVRLGAQQLASRRLQNRYDAVKQGAQRFRDQADTLVKDAIKKPPEHLSGFGVVADAVLRNSASGVRGRGRYCGSAQGSV